MLVLGAGLQGSACAYDLLNSNGVRSVRLADQDVDKLPPFLLPYVDDDRLERMQIDARDADSVRRALAGMDACMNALPYYFNLEITKLAVEAGVHYCDLGGNTAIVFDQLKLDDDALRKGISVVPDCGLAPGMVNILAAKGIEAMDRADSVKIRVGGLPQNPEGPLNYQIVYSIEGVLDYYTTKSWVVREGKPTEVDALTEIEPVEFPAPVGTLEAFHTAGGLSVMPWNWQGKVRTMEYKTLRYPGHAATMRAVRDLGLLELTPVDVKGTTVVPRDVFIAQVEPRLRRPQSRDLVALRIEVEGEKDGKPHRIQWDLIDRMDEAHGISAMERTTGFSLSIIAQIQTSGRARVNGVKTPDVAIPADLYISELRKRGIEIRETAE
ncbi:MAG: saccharopine dehydrogenase family protein [Longimicrobiales bacterium]